METKIKHSIENFERLTTSDVRRQVLRIAEAGLNSIVAGPAVGRQVLYDQKKQKLKIQKQEFDLKKFDRVICLGFGLASMDAARELENILGNKISFGLVIGLTEERFGAITIRAGAYPTPTKKNIDHTKELLEIVSQCTEKDLVICAVSSGGDELLYSPYNLSPESEYSIISTLRNAGASQEEVVTVRKHISTVLGGNVATHMYPATIINLIFSDAPGDNPSVVASGPMVMDTTTSRDAANILDAYQVLETCQLPACKLVETPKEKKYFEKVHSFIITSGRHMLAAMSEAAEDLGHEVEIFSRDFYSDAKKIGPEVISRSKKGICLMGAGKYKSISGGLDSPGHEMALTTLSLIAENQALVSLRSDTRDVAGAIADASTLLKAHALHIDPKLFLQNNDSLGFFESVDDAVVSSMAVGSGVDFFVILSKYKIYGF